MVSTAPVARLRIRRARRILRRATGAVLTIPL
jgi:hypothetical protein